MNEKKGKRKARGANNGVQGSTDPWQEVEGRAFEKERRDRARPARKMSRVRRIPTKNPHEGKTYFNPKRSRANGGLIHNPLCPGSFFIQGYCSEGRCGLFFFFFFFNKLALPRLQIPPNRAPHHAPCRSPAAHDSDQAIPTYTPNPTKHKFPYRPAAAAAIPLQFPQNRN